MSVGIRTKDTAMVPSSQPSPDLLEIRFQNLIKTKIGVTTKNTMLGIRTRLAWLWAASSGVRNAIASGRIRKGPAVGEQQQHKSRRDERKKNEISKREGSEGNSRPYIFSPRLPASERNAIGLKQPANGAAKVTRSGRTV